MKLTGEPINIKPFPKNKLGTMLSITLKAPTGDCVEIKYSDLTLRIINGQLCFYYESEDGNLLMPIFRISQLNNKGLK